MPMRRLSVSALFLLVLALCAGCSGRAWRAAVSEDTASAYHRYLRDHPDSTYAEQARARLALVRVRSKPTPAAFEKFRKQFPDSPFIEELRPHVEKAFFEQARAEGTSAAYARFLGEFPAGAHAARAEGNRAYLEARGFAGDLSRLAGFASEHPASDFAAEAERSVALVGLRGRTGFDQVGLVLDVPADVPSRDRLGRLFTERALEAYRRSGLRLVPVSGTTDPRLQSLPARLTVSHRERHVRTELVEGRVSQPGMLAETTLTLSKHGQETPIWSETLSFRVPESEAVPGESILLHPRAWGQFWEQGFFAPIASWDTLQSVRAPRKLAKAPVAVEMVGSRAIVLFGDGDFQMLDLGDPESPALLGEYQRERDLAHFEGVVSLSGGVGVFGPDGIEIIAMDGPARRERAYSRSQVGSVVSLVALGDDLVAAGNRGLLLLAKDGSVKTLFPREVLGLERRGDRLLFTDGTSLYIAPLAVLQQGRVESELRLGRGFRPARVRLSGSSAIVLGDPGLVWVDVSTPSKPRLVSRMGTEEVGEIQDASVVGGRVFLVGPRGLQVSDRSGDRVVDSVDVAARHRIEVAGRHVVLIGEGQLQVVDASAFMKAAPAAPAR